jgi:serine/threonine protein kinase
MTLRDIIGRSVRGKSGREYFGLEAYASNLNVTDKKALLKGKCEKGKVFIKYVREGSSERSFHLYRDMQKDAHPNIVPMLDMIQFQGNTFAVYPFLSYIQDVEFSKNLAEIYSGKRNNNRFSTSRTKHPHETIGELSALALTQFLIDVAQYLRRKNVIETDIRPQNIIVCFDGVHPILNLCDLEGLLPGKVEKESNLLTMLDEEKQNYFFTNQYGAPELFYSQLPNDEVPITEKVMVYAIGRVLAAAFYSHSRIIERSKIKEALKQGGDIQDSSLLQVEDFWRENGIMTAGDILFNEFVPERFRKLIAGGVETNPEHRYNLAEFSHKFRGVKASYDPERYKTYHRQGFKLFDHAG